jgi:SAM-dependent methyltransferase
MVEKQFLQRRVRMAEEMNHGPRSGGDANYGVISPAYSKYRKADARIARVIHGALGDAESVLNVGAGTGSYEPEDRVVTAVEPSADMRARRSSTRPKAIDAVAEALPFEDASFAASMTTFSVHQWPDLARGLSEMRRVTRGPVVVLTGDPGALHRFWLADYCPEVLDVEARRYPPLATIVRHLGGACEVISVPVPADCTDGFQEAYFGRPEAFLDPEARRACSAWSFVDAAVVRRFEGALARDLSTGSWDARYGHFRREASFDGSLRLVIGRR